MRVSAPTIIGVFALAVSAAGCDEKLADVAGPTPNLQPTLASIQRDIFSAADSSGRAACTQCHNAGNRNNAASLSLAEGAAFGDLVNVPSRNKAGAVRVIPGDPDGSYLIQKLEGRSDIVGQRMPRTGGPFLTPGQISIIRRWIELGARND
jgi:hypothetical protein